METINTISIVTGVFITIAGLMVYFLSKKKHHPTH